MGKRVMLATLDFMDPTVIAIAVVTYIVNRVMSMCHVNEVVALMFQMTFRSVAQEFTVMEYENVSRQMSIMFCRDNWKFRKDVR